jgi:uncharacterized protein (TIGR02757 family)
MSSADAATLDKLRQFVQEFSDVVDLQFSTDPNLPKLPVDPRDKSPRTAHHMLLVASIDQRTLVGASENARALLVRFHESMGEKLYSERNKDTFDQILLDFENAPRLGFQMKEIPRILSSVNRFVAEKTGGDLVQWGRGFESPSLIVDTISQGIDWMGATPNSARKKAWMYMRWMVRPYPDLRIWENLSPRELFVPVDYNVAKVASMFHVIPRQRLVDWSDVISITNFARVIFPEDPAKVDYPFFLLGRGDTKALASASRLGLRPTGV